MKHTSGLIDYAMDTGLYSEKTKSNPLKVWTRTEQFEFAMHNVTKRRYSGKKYNYSDTRYILLGEILENTTGKNL